MDSFEDLGLAPELIETLAAEGIERPTAFQEGALPLVRRGNNVVGRAGPGAGTLVAYGVGLLDRLFAEDGEAASADEAEEEGEEPGAEPEGIATGAGASGPRAVLLAPTADAARRMAASLSRFAPAVDLRVASTSGAWVLPERADLLVSEPGELLDAVRSGRVSLARLRALAVEQFSATVALSGPEALDTLFEFAPEDAQRLVLDLPRREGEAALDAFVGRHVKRAVNVPPRAVEDEAREVPERGEVRYRIVEEPADEGGLDLTAELLEDPDVRHLLAFFRSEDRAADIGDWLALHGYGSGPVGDPEVPVWLSVDALEARAALQEMDEEEREGVHALSWDVPADPDALDRRHGGGRGGHVLVLPREMPHLRDVARRTGYRVVPAPPPAEERIADDLVRTVERLDEALAGGEDIGAYLLVLESLFEDHDPAEVAAAAVALLRRDARSAARGAAERAVVPGAAPAQPSAGAAAPTGAGRGGATARPGSPTPPGSRGSAFVRLFVSIGEKDGAGPGDIVGAIGGETGVNSSKIGRIDLRETFSIVEVEESVAERIIRGLNGITVRGRSVRVDYDRPRGGGEGPKRGGGASGGRPGGGRGGPGGARGGGGSRGPTGGGRGGPRGGGGSGGSRGGGSGGSRGGGARGGGGSGTRGG